MLKKFVISFAIILSIAIAPLCFVGCKGGSKNDNSKYTGLYVFDEINLKVNGQTKYVSETLSDDEIAAHDPSELVELESLHAAKLYGMKMVLYFVVEEIGAYLKNDGTLEFNFSDYVAPAEDADEPDLSQFGKMLEDATWFAHNNKIYINGLYTQKTEEKGIERIFDNSLSICCTIVGKNLELKFSLRDNYNDDTQDYTYTEDYTFVLHRSNEI